MLYYGTKISDNLSRREPEGYLLCLNVPVARTGVQEYLPEELGLDLGSFSLPESRATGEPKGTVPPVLCNGLNYTCPDAND